MSELQQLLQELQNMKQEERKNHIENNKSTWSKIGNKDLESLGFETVEEMQEFILSNPYSNIA